MSCSRILSPPKDATVIILLQRFRQDHMGHMPFNQSCSQHSSYAVYGLAPRSRHGFPAGQRPSKYTTDYLMHYETVAALFVLVLLVLLWNDVLRLNGPTLPKAHLAPVDQPIEQEARPSPKMSSCWSKSPTDLLACICTSYGPVNLNTSDRDKIIDVLGVLVTLSSVFEKLMYVGGIEVDEVLAYYPLLSELLLIKRRCPKELETMLKKLPINWPLPKGNVMLSLLISTGQCLFTRLRSLASYLPYISDKRARSAAANRGLDDCTENSVLVSFDYNHRRALCSAFDPCVVSKLKQMLNLAPDSAAFIASSLLHLAPADMDGALVDALDEALDIVAKKTNSRCFYEDFAMHSVVIRDSESMQAIFERNAHAFQAIPFSPEQQIALSALNKVKFGALQDMNQDEWEYLFRIWVDPIDVPLVFHIWAREDVDDAFLAQFANLDNDLGILYDLAFDLEGFFQHHFNVEFFSDLRFLCFLNEFKYYPTSIKKERFLTLLRDKVRQRSETVLALLWDPLDFKKLIAFFADQRDEEGLKALKDVAFESIIEGLGKNMGSWQNVRIYQLVSGCVDGGSIADPLGLLAQRFGAAEVLRLLDFSLIPPNDMGKMLSTLGISKDQMDVAISSVNRIFCPSDKLAAVLWQFHKDARGVCASSNTLPARHALWFYLWEEHQEAFVKYIHLNLQQYYQSDKQSP